MVRPFLVVLILSMVICGCASEPPVAPAKNSNEDNGQVTMKQSPVLIHDEPEMSAPRIEELRAELVVIDGQLVDLDALIKSSREQMDGYRSINAAGAETLAEKAQLELYIYEAKRTRLIGHRARLQSELTELLANP